MAKGLGKNAVVLTASKVITTLLALVTAMMLARFRTLEEYGTYSQLLLVINLATSLFMLGLPNSTNYFLARCETHEERQHFLSVYYTLNTLLCVVMGVTLYFALPIIVEYFHNPTIMEYAFFLVIFPWVSVILGSISNILVVYDMTGKLMLFNVINAATTLASVLLVQAMGWTFREYMITYLLVDVVLAIWVYAIVWKLECALPPSLDNHLVSMIFRYSIPIGLAALVGTVSIEIDKLLIARLFSTEDLAVYTNAAKELPVSIISSSLTAVLLPKMARMLKENDTRGAVWLWGQSILLSYTFMCYVVMVVEVFAPQVLVLLYSEKYLAGVSVFRVYSLVLLLRTTYFGLMLNATGKTNFIFYSSILSLVANAALNYLMYVLLGFTGPALATFLAVGVVDFAQLLATSRSIGVPIAQLFPWKGLAGISFVNGAIGLVAYICTRVVDVGTDVHGVLVAVLMGIAVTIAYILVMRKPALSMWSNLNHAD